ncbi:hypothetical protein ADK52_03540 [Streptomyces sp. WM6372]|uniref:hypothetical protein n=1 Tax=Streptomyces sp. WM6372 TaxID=1415555 RepID=UPI0006AE2DF9|nr:hypothetical protein [Streptomyces sp. WM6372]KOU31262.1 hypothetical protein ADK52_03540 [Streptomyces sp. WM6372]
MWRRAQAIGDKDVAREMRRVFRRILPDSRHDPAAVAKAYGQLMYKPSAWGHTEIRGERKFIEKCFNVGLRDESCEFEQLTKRAVLVSDSLLLSHGPDAPYRHLGEDRRTDVDVDDNMQPRGSDSRTTHYGIHCPDLAALGTWLLEAEPLIKSGLAWYLPSYSTRTEFVSSRASAATHRRSYPISQVAAVDYIIRGGRVIDSSESNPVKDRLVRPVLQIDLPFIEGVTLSDFSKITVDEFDSYSGFRGFLRTSFLSMDEALNAEQSQVELAKLRLEIEDQVSAMQTELRAAKRKRSLGVVGATVASTAALLVAVEGSVMERVLTTLGLTTAGTFWGAIKDRVENGPRAIQSGKWYYVWILAQKSRAL